MRTISTAIALSSLLLGAPAFASAGHEHGPGGSHAHGAVKAATATKKAEGQVKSLIEWGRIAPARAPLVK